MTSTRRAEDDFNEAERRIQAFIQQNRANLMGEGVRYAGLLNQLYAIEPRLDDEDYLAKMSEMKRRGVLSWGPTGIVRLVTES